MDRRQQKTRRAVFKAFTSLLEKKPYSKISVQEIIDEADIGRSTFYSHFGTKDELLRAMCTDIFDHVFSDPLASESTHDFSLSGRDLKGEVTHILYHLRDNRASIKSILSCESGEMFMRYFKEYLARFFEKELEKHTFGVPKDYMLNHTVCDFAETVRWWMKNGDYSPENVAGFFLGTTPFDREEPARI